MISGAAGFKFERSFDASLGSGTSYTPIVPGLFSCMCVNPATLASCHLQYYDLVAPAWADAVVGVANTPTTPLIGIGDGSNFRVHSDPAVFTLVVMRAYT